MMALGHTPAQDEILKNTYANHAFENFEIAAYTSLLAIGDAAGLSAHRAGLTQSLDEEKAMAQRVHDLIVPTTQRYVQLTASGEKADR